MTAPSSKIELIRRLMQLDGTQQRIDSWSFLDRYAFPGSPLFATASTAGATIGQAGRVVVEALRAAYRPHRHVWQDEYEAHRDGAFTGQELAEIVAFLEREVGARFLDARQRFDAYIGTNTEHLVEQVIAAAEHMLRATRVDGNP